MELVKGTKSPEFLVTMLIVAPWVCNSMGIDLQQLAPYISAIMGIDLSPAMIDASRIRETIEAANRQTDAPIWVGLAFVVGRPVLQIAAQYLRAKGAGGNDNSNAKA